MHLCQPQELIEVFDRCLIFVYGQKYARDNPHKSDEETAKKWADAGCDVFISAIVFHERMSMMHERFLRNKELREENRRNIPAALSVFEENIYLALRVEGVGGVIDITEISDSQWRARLFGYKNGRGWHAEMWGPIPDEPGCRVPIRILKE